MLKIYRELFQKLERNSLKYVIYKGLVHLDDDLSGSRGDLDVLIDRNRGPEFHEVIVSCGFHRINRINSRSIQYLGRDVESGKQVMLDLEYSIKLGDGRSTLTTIDYDIDKLSIKQIEFDSVKINVLGDNDYLPLMLLYRTASNSPKQSSLDELKEMEVDSSDVENSYFGKFLCSVDSSMLYAFRMSDWPTMQKQFKRKILRYFIDGKDFFNLITSAEIFAYETKDLVRKGVRLIGGPPSPTGKGRIVAIVGVDGAGKSSVVDSVMKDEFFKNTGIKRIYFGSNEFFTYRILDVYKSLSTSKFFKSLRIFPSLLMNFERRLRIIKALYYRALGNTVICDRYFYDDEVVRKKIIDSETDSISRKIKLAIYPKVTLVPDLTLYLDVSPEIAYKRKQDFDFNTMLEVNAQYRSLMMSRSEVTFVDADKSFSYVSMLVKSEIIRLKRE